MAGLPTAAGFGNPLYSNPVSLDELYRQILNDLGYPASSTQPTDMHAILRLLDLYLFLNGLTANQSVSEGPTNCVAAPYSRYAINNGAVALSTGTLYAVGVWLPQNLVISNINWLPGTTGDAGPTNQWGVIMNSSRVVVANTADATSTAVVASTPVTYAIANVAAGAATSYTVPTSGLYYIGINVTTSNSPTFSGYTGLAGRDTNVTPKLNGTSTTGNTTPLAVGGSAQTAITAVANVPYFYLT